ncbi:MAG: hypothetical protein NC078_08535 [Ruminococcus sp.]|nr:hypothetical protein [Ruminococcus sp.]
MIKFGENNPSLPFILNLTEEESGGLHIIAALSARGEKGEGADCEPVKEILKEAYPICPDMSEVYEIVFEDYILYQCRNESYFCGSPDDIFRGLYFVVYESSRLLEFYKYDLFDISDDSVKAARRHYGIIAADHIIDIISDSPPIVKKL